MTLDPFLHAPFFIQFHTVCAIYALVIGPVALFSRRKGRWHRWTGRSWVLAMALTAISAAFIFTIRIVGPFSPIHILVPVTLYGLWHGVSLIRKRKVGEHARHMRGLYFGAMGVAGLFTLLPGRLMSEILSPGAPWAAFAAAAMVLVFGVWRAYRGGLPLSRPATRGG